jgi:hypothetical protein
MTKDTNSSLGDSELSSSNGGRRTGVQIGDYCLKLVLYGSSSVTRYPDLRLLLHIF